MSTPEHDLRVDYVELPATDVGAAKAFYSQVFGWEFVDYGPTYTAFSDGRLEGGLNGERKVPAEPGGTLVVIYAVDIHAVEAKVLAAGGRVSMPIFEFPGGRRFHFVDPSGNELAVWSHPSPDA